MSALVKYIQNVFHFGSKFSTFGKCKMVLIIRTDIAMGKGKLAAQCAHAAVECHRQVIQNKKYEGLYRSWLVQGQPKIVLRVSNEEELLTLARNARKSGLIISVIKDAGKTQLVSGTITTLGIGPGPIEVIDDLTTTLRLL